MKEEDRLSHEIIAAAIEVHRHLGPGLLESSYESCLAQELVIRELAFERQVPIPLEYKGSVVDCGFRLDFVVNRLVIVELKAVQRFDPIDTAQVLTYLKLSGIKLGLLINFNMVTLKDGIKRVVNQL